MRRAEISPPCRAWARKRPSFAGKASRYQFGFVSTTCRAHVARVAKAPISPKLGRPIQPMQLSATRECAVGASRAANASPSSDIPVLLAAGNPNMDRQRYCRQLTRYRNTLRVSVDPVAAGEEIADLVGRRRHPPPVETDGS